MQFTPRKHPRRARPSLETLEIRALLANAGALDPMFGDRGVVTLPLNPQTSATATQAVSNLGVLQADGKIVLGGSDVRDGEAYFEINRLETDGSLDPSFGQGGRVSIPVSTSKYPLVEALVVQANGSIIEVGSLGTTYGAVRVNPDGTIDTSYGIQGVAALPAMAGNNLTVDRLGGVALTADGKLVVEGSAYDASALPVVGLAGPSAIFADRLDANGTLDTTFGNSGIATVSVTLNNIMDDTATAIAIQPGGQILLGGEAVYASFLPEDALSDAVVIGLNADGSLDTTFGGASAAGRVILARDPSDPGASGDRELTGLAVASDSSIVLSGSVSPLGSLSPFDQVGSLVRLKADGTLDLGFGRGSAAINTGALLPQGVTIEGDGEILTPGSIPDPGQPGARRFALGRYNPVGTPDATFGQVATPGLASYPTSGDPALGGRLSTAMVDPSGRIVLVGQTYNATSSFFHTNNFAVLRASDDFATTPAVSEPPADLGGTGQTDLAVYLPALGEFAYRPSTSEATQFIAYGPVGDGQSLPAVADYEGVGHAEIAVYLPKLGVYAIQPTATSSGLFVPFGVAGTGQSIPTPADFDGDGKADVAVYVPSYGAFGIRPSSGGSDEIIPFGTPGVGRSIPAPADYLGTGRDDLAVYLTDSGSFAIRQPGGGADIVGQFGIPGLGNSIPVPGDYDGSGHIELAVYLPSLGEFIYRPTGGGPDVTVKFGTPGVGEIPVPGDYDGSGRTEVAVYDPARGFFAYHPANGGNDVIADYGTSHGGSIPVATSSGVLPEFAFPSSVSGTGAIRLILASPSPSSGTSAIGTARASSTVLAGSSVLAQIRVTRSLVNQGSTDPSSSTP